MFLTAQQLAHHPRPVTLKYTAHHQHISVSTEKNCFMNKTGTSTQTDSKYTDILYLSVTVIHLVSSRTILIIVTPY